MITIIQDSREQIPLQFTCKAVVQKLDFGDYSCVLDDGFIVPVAVERKEISDLFSTLTHQYDRFKNEIIRCQEAKFKMILLIEGSLTKVSKGIKHSKRPGDSVLAQIFTLWVKYGIFPVFAKDAIEAATYVEYFFKAYEKKYLIKKNSSCV